MLAKVVTLLGVTMALVACAHAKASDASNKDAGTDDRMAQMADPSDDLKAYVDEVFADVDRDGDEKISKSEFAALAQAQNPGVEIDEAMLDSMFGELDTDGDGYITKVEYALIAMKQLNQ